MMVLNLCQNEERKTINLQATSSKAELCQHLEQHTDPGPAYLACERSLKLPFLFQIVYLDDSTRILFYLCTEYCCS